jgi:hypothetical protein
MGKVRILPMITGTGAERNFEQCGFCSLELGLGIS